MLRLGKSEKEFQELYLTQGPRVRRTLTGMVGSVAIAEELTQEAFAKAWKGLPQFGLRSTMKTWLYQVAINTGRDWLRAHKGKLQVDWVDEGKDPALTPERRAVQEALLELEEGTREVLVLHYYEGMAMEELGAVLQIPIGTVKSRLFTAKAKLKDILLTKGFDV